MIAKTIIKCSISSYDCKNCCNKKWGNSECPIFLWVIMNTKGLFKCMDTYNADSGRNTHAKYATKIMYEAIHPMNP